MTPKSPPTLLVDLLRFVPNIRRLASTSVEAIRLYDHAMGVIARNRSDDFVEWDHLAQIIRQDRALLQAAK